MVDKLKNTRPYNLIPLLVMLYVAAGLPLVHPIFHTHSEHDQSIVASCGLLLQGPEVDGKAHHCPICDFEATNQLHATACNTGLAGSQFIYDVVSIGSSFSLKARPQHMDARAPPALSAIS